MHIVLLGQPLSTNHIYKSHCKFGRPNVYMSAEGKALSASYKYQIKSQLGIRTPLDQPLGIVVVLYFGDKRKRDIDNHSKILLDSMSGLAYEDDSQIQTLVVAKQYDKKNPRIEIDIYLLMGNSPLAEDA